jgi:hypothetical protein
MAPDEIARASLDARRNADEILVRALRPALSPMAAAARSGPAPVVTALRAERVATAHGCDVLTPSAAFGIAEVEYPASGLVVRAHRKGPALVQLRRFAPDYEPPRPTRLARLFTRYGEFVGPTQLTVGAGTTRALRLPPDRLARRWYVRLVSARPMVACVAARY